MVFLLSALLILSAFSMPVYGSTWETEEQPNQSMIVNASWLDDEMLRIDVMDTSTGAVSSLAVRLSDFVTDSDVGSSPYIMIQAVDLDGNLSGIIQISNPFYVPADSTATTGNGGQVATPPGQNASDVNGADDSANDGNGYAGESPQLGLTPDGTGTVVDNVVTQNDLEFFTVFTEAGNVFYLVVDRQRNTENVYLLNAVTEADLMALAQESSNPTDNTTVSGIPTPPTVEPPAEDAQPPATPQPEPEPEATPSNDGGNSSLIFIAVIVVAVGGAAYYFKIVKGKKASSEPDDDYWDEDEDDSGEYIDDYMDSGGTDEGSDDE